MVVKVDLISGVPDFYWAVIQLEYGKPIRGVLPRDLALLMRPPYLDSETELSGTMLNGITKFDGVTHFNFRLGEIRSVNLTPIMTRLETEEIRKTLEYHLEDGHEKAAPDEAAGCSIRQG